jgi:hypothetical protein
MVRDPNCTRGSAPSNKQTLIFDFSGRAVEAMVSISQRGAKFGITLKHGLAKAEWEHSGYNGVV